MAARDTRSSARRRRERRLRAQWRHEQQTVAMALAAATHHSAQRGEWRDLYEAPRGERTASAEATYDALRSQTTSVAGDTEFFSLYEEELRGTRPDRLYEVRPQERDQRRTVEQIVDSTLIVPSLDVPVPQMANQLLEVCRQLDTSVPKQVIEVPKISSTPRHSRRRRVRFAEQMAEQLVEVPTIISYSSLRGIVEQNVDIPVPHGRGRVGGGGLLGLHPGQSSTAFGGAEHFPAATAEHLVDIPVPAPRGGRVLHPASSSSGLPGMANQGFFSHFSDNSSSTPAAQLEGFLRGRSQCLDAISRWLVEPSGLGPRSLAAWVKAGTGPSSCVSLRLLVEEFRRIFLSFVLAQFALGIWYIIFLCPCFWQLCSGRLGIAEEYGN